MINKKFLLEEEKHHDEVAEAYSLRRETDFIWQIPEQMYLLKRRYFSPKSIIIDMGCGPSTPIRNSFKKEWMANIEYIGVDISSKMLKIASRNISSGMFKQGDVQTIPFPSNYADVIIALGTLHHSLDKGKTLLHWYNILKKGGYLLLREPTYEALKHGEGESPHEEGIKINNLLSFVENKKMRIIRFIYFDTQFFHLFNKIMIKLGWKTWEGFLPLGYFIVFLDVYLSRFLGKFNSSFRGDAFIMIIQKI